MVTKKYYNELRTMYSLVRLILLYGGIELLKKWENGNYGYYLIKDGKSVIRITEKEYEFAYKARYQEE